MKKQKLSTQLSIGFAMIVFIVIGLISISANLLIRSQFASYMESEQARLAQELAYELANQYHVTEHSWNIDYIHGVGMYAVNDGYFLKLLDTEHHTVWDIEQHDMACCEEMMKKILSDMNQLRNAEGSFISHEYPMYQGKMLIGYADIMYYTPYYMNENAFHFLYSLNLILVVTGMISIIGAVITGLILAKRITAPVSGVIRQTKRISEGDYSACTEQSANSLELYELSQAVTAMAQTLERQEKLRQRLTGDVAHELRTPLTNIASHLEMMCEGIWQPTSERLESCYEEITRIAGLVDDMEKLHQIDSEQLILHKSRFSVRPVLENTAAMFERETADKNITLEINCNEISIHADKDRITQVVTNLLSNAVKYTGTNGHICIDDKNDDSIFRLTVSDTGIGIAPDDLLHIFERFYRADKSRNRSTGGSGIGLAVAKAIVEAHGGTISVKSESEKGSAFIVTLPTK